MDAANTDKAAAKIQAGFRGYQVRKRMQLQKKANNKLDDKSDEEIVNDEEEAEYTDDGLTTENKVDSTLEDKSATKIQAGIRGYLVRKRQQAEQAAATKIQAGFRGFRTRKLLKQSGQ